MPNVWGTNTPPIYTAYVDLAGTGPVTLTAGSEINVMSLTQVSADQPGNYFPVVWCDWTIVFTATPPAALTFAMRIGAGSDLDSNKVPPAIMVASSTAWLHFMLMGSPSKTAWVGAGSTLNITGLAGTNSCTVAQLFSQTRLALFRASDTG